MNLMLITSRITDHDLDLRALRKPKEQKLTDLIIEKRMIRSRKLLSKDTWKRLQIAFFSDRIIFKMKQPYNSHKHVIYVPKKSATRKIILRN